MPADAQETHGSPGAPLQGRSLQGHRATSFLHRRTESAQLLCPAPGQVESAEEWPLPTALVSVPRAPAGREPLGPRPRDPQGLDSRGNQRARGRSVARTVAWAPPSRIWDGRPEGPANRTSPSERLPWGQSARGATRTPPRTAARRETGPRGAVMPCPGLPPAGSRPAAARTVPRREQNGLPPEDSRATCCAPEPLGAAPTRSSPSAGLRRGGRWPWGLPRAEGPQREQAGARGGAQPSTADEAGPTDRLL